MSNEPWNAKLQDEFEQLMSDLLDERLDSAAQTRLGELLSQFDAARKLYVEHCSQHNELYWLDQSAVPDASFNLTRSSLPIRSVGPSSAFGGRWQVAGALTLVGALAALVLFMLTLAKSKEEGPQPIATLVAEHQAVWKTTVPTVAGANRGASRQVLPGTLDLTDGRAELQISDVRLTLLAPVQLELIDARTVRVLNGRIRAVVGPESVGFRVLTATMDVVDLGTEFGIAVDEDGGAAVHVFKGVVVASAVGQRQVVPIYENEAGLAVDGGTITGIDVDPKQFALTPAMTLDHLPPAADAYQPIDSKARIVVVGDESYDRETPLLLVSEAYCTAGRSGPKLINASVHKDYREWFEARVADYHPTHVVLAFVAEFAMRATQKHPPAEASFEQQLRELADMAEAHGAEVVLATGHIPQTNQRPDAPAAVRAYNDVVRALAAERGYRLADVARTWEILDAADSIELLSGPGRMPSFEGFRVVARGLLEAFGASQLPVPNRLTLSLEPGVITNWRYRIVPATFIAIGREPITHPDVVGGWQTLALPQTDRLTARMPEPSQLLDYQNRMRGFATNLLKEGRTRVEAETTVDSPAERDAVLYVGGKLQSVWLNGESVYQRKEWGWIEHVGRDRVAIRLRAGSNQILVKAANSFFVSITGKNE